MTASVLAWIVVSSLTLALFEPFVALAIAISPVALYLLCTRSELRVALVVVGGILVLGSLEVGATKIVYACVFLVCALISSVRLLLSPPTWFGPFRSVIILGLALMVSVFLAIVANPSDDMGTVVRLAIFYLMIPFAPIIGIDAGRDARPLVVMRWIVVIGCVAAAGFAADWLSRRGVSSLPFGRFVVSSLVLPALAFALSLVRAAYSRGMARIGWLAPLILIPAAMLVTGTRTNLIVFLAILGVLGTTATRRVTPGKALGLTAFGAAAIALALPALANALVSQPGFVESRVQALTMVLSGNAAGDQSFAMRNEQYYYAAQWIAEGPFFGKGPGFTTSISLDTPLATVIHIGVLGTVMLGLFLLAFLVATLRTAKSHGYTFMHTAATGLAVVIVANLPFGPVVLDKGFGFSLVLLSMGIAASVQERVDAKNEHQTDLPQIPQPSDKLLVTLQPAQADTPAQSLA